MLLVFFTACNKDGLLVDSNELPDSSDVLVKDGELFFPDVEAFHKVCEFIKTADENEIMYWQNKIGFKSVSFHYFSAKKSLGVNETQEDWEKLKANYTDLIKIDGHKIRPRLEIGSFGWLIGKNNQLRVGKSIVYYTADEYSISVPDGDLDKLERAKLTKQSDAGNGIYVHPVVISRDSRLRNCGNIIIDDFRSPNDQRKIDIRFGVLNTSVVIGSITDVRVEAKVYFDHEKRAFLGIWNGDPTICTYDCSVSGNISLPEFSINGPISFSENNFVTGNESRYERLIPLITPFFVNSSSPTINITVNSLAINLDQTSENGDDRITNLGDACP